MFQVPLPCRSASKVHQRYSILHPKPVLEHWNLLRDAFHELQRGILGPNVRHVILQRYQCHCTSNKYNVHENVIWNIIHRYSNLVSQRNPRDKRHRLSDFLRNLAVPRWQRTRNWSKAIWLLQSIDRKQSVKPILFHKNYKLRYRGRACFDFYPMKYKKHYGKN